MDLPGIDRGLLVCLGGVEKVGEEVRPIGPQPPVEPRIQRPGDRPAGVQSLMCRPGLAAGVPGLASGSPVLPAPMQPGRLGARIRGRQPGEAPARGGLVEALPRPFHDHHRAVGDHHRAHQVQHGVEVAYVAARCTPPRSPPAAATGNARTGPGGSQARPAPRGRHRPRRNRHGSAPGRSRRAGRSRSRAPWQERTAARHGRTATSRRASARQTS
jgi:hypothetical protein